MTADSVPAPMVQVPAELVEELRDALTQEEGSFHWRVTAARAVVDAATPAATIEASGTPTCRTGDLTAQVSIPAADILALADQYQKDADESDNYGGELWSTTAAALRALVAAAEQADKGEAADTPRERQPAGMSACQDCGMLMGRIDHYCRPPKVHAWEEGETGYECVDCGRVEKVPVNHDCGEGRPAGKSQGAASAGEPPEVCDALTAPAAPPAFDVRIDNNANPRVPVNDEAEALCAERDAYRDQSDEDQKARGRLVMELDTLRELASAYLAAWGGGIPKLWHDAFTALGIEAMDDIQAAFDLAQSLAARGEDA